MHKIRNFHGHSTVGEWNGRVVAWERHGMCESVFKTAGEQHGNGMLCVNPPLFVSRVGGPQRLCTGSIETRPYSLSAYCAKQKYTLISHGNPVMVQYSSVLLLTFELICALY
jgi:hypothetical protein